MKFNKLIVNNEGNGLEKYIGYESVFLKILNNYGVDIKPNYTVPLQKSLPRWILQIEAIDYCLLIPTSLLQSFVLNIFC